MKKRNIKRIFSSVTAVLFAAVMVIAFVPVLPAAHAASSGSISEINIDVSLDDAGNASMTETWTVDVPDDWSEMYIVKDNLDGSDISGLSVYDVTTATQYTDVGGSWDVNLSRSQKAGKCGTFVDSDGATELCWGVGSSGTHVYKVTYNMSNVVNAYTDGYDGFNQRFINEGLSSEPDKIKITIEKPGTSFTSDDTKVWAFGFEGQINVTDGKIVAESSGEVNYCGVMVRFNDGIFTPASTSEKSFSEVESAAKEGSYYSKNDNGSSIISKIISWVFGALIVFAAVFLPMIAAKKNASNLGDKASKSIDVSSIPSEQLKDPPYSHDIPMYGNLEAAYTALHAMHKAPSDGSIMSAYILRWLQNGVITVKKTPAKKFLGLIGDTMQSSIIFNKEPDDMSAHEKRLLSMLKRASGGDQILQEKEFERWAKDNYEQIEDWYDDAVADGIEMIESHGMTEKTEKKVLFIKYQVNSLTEKGRSDFLAVLGFRHYLKDFTIINERQVKEVELWKDYLVFAALYGIADEVAKEFADICPDYFTDPGKYGYGGAYGPDMFDMYIMMNMANSIASAGASGYRAGQTAAQAATASSGGGGFSSFGGGGGFSGGGFGGGGR